MINTGTYRWPGLVALMLGSMLLATLASARDIPDDLETPAMKSELAQKNLLQSVVRAGDGLVAIGVKGHILVSKDSGATWTQADVPVSTNLTSVYFPSATKGWAVGHDQVVLHTRDGGMTWELQFSNPVVDDRSTDEVDEAWATRGGRPLLGVYFQDESKGWAVGAFGLVLRTENGGKSWKRMVMPNLDPNREEWDPVELEYHLNVVNGRDGELYIAGESGTVYRSPDGGASWEALVTPYTGSYYGLTITRDGKLIAYGLRGNMFSSADKGQIWKRVDSQTDQNLLGSYYDESADTLVVVGTKGAVLYSGDGGQRFDVRIRENRVDMTGVAGAPDGTVAITGMKGVDRLKSNGAEI